MKRLICFSLFIFIASCLTSSYSQKAYKPIRSLLKEKKGKDALNYVKKLEADSAYMNDPKLYDLGKDANMIIYAIENEKLYLKKQYDTITFFQSIYGIYDYILRCENKEKMLLEKENIKPKFQKTNRTYLHSFYKNIGAGGKYFSAKKQYAEAMKFMELYLEVPKTEIWGKKDNLVSEKSNTISAYIYQKSAYQNGDYNKVDRYNDITLNDSMLRRNVIDLMVGTAEKTNDTLQMLDYLKIGISEYSNHPFYFTKLYEYFVNQEKYDEAYHLADSLSVVYPDSTLYSYSKVYPLIKVEKFDEAIEEANKVIQNDTMHVDLHYYLGFAYYKLANAIKLPTSINSSQYRTKSKIQKDYYKKALPHLEKYKSNYPENIDKWGYLLHDIYWALNMGKQYDEIIKVLNK